MSPPSGHRAKHDLISRRAQRCRNLCLYCDRLPPPTQSLPSPHGRLWVISRHRLRAGKLLVQVSPSWKPAGARSPPETAHCGPLASPPLSKYKNQTLQCWSLPFYNAQSPTELYDLEYQKCACSNVVSLDGPDWFHLVIRSRGGFFFAYERR